MLYIRKPTKKEYVEINVNKNIDENEIYKSKRERESRQTYKEQVNRHIHTKHTGKQLLYSH